MDVSRDRDEDAFGAKGLPDGPDGFYLPGAGHGDADEFRSSLSHAPALRERGFHVGGVRVAHGLYGDRASAADDEAVTNLHRECLHRGQED